MSMYCGNCDEDFYQCDYEYCPYCGDTLWEEDEWEEKYGKRNPFTVAFRDQSDQMPLWAVREVHDALWGEMRRRGLSKDGPLYDTPIWVWLIEKRYELDDLKDDQLENAFAVAENLLRKAESKFLRPDPLTALQK